MPTTPNRPSGATTTGRRGAWDLTGIEGWLDDLTAGDPGVLSGTDQARLVQQLSRLERRLAAVRLRVLAAVDRDHTAAGAGGYVNVGVGGWSDL